MIDLKYHGISVRTSLDSGVYVFPQSSANGKTYLGTILRLLGETDRVSSYTLEDTSLFDISVVLNREKFDLVLLDRYDMYFGVGLDLIQEFGKTGIVLIDCKAFDFPFKVRPCHIQFEADKLVVFG